jgi:hypothetical protein
VKLLAQLAHSQKFSNDLLFVSSLLVGKPKNLPPSRRIKVLEHCGLAHFEIMSQWRLLHTLDVESRCHVARKFLKEFGIYLIETAIELKYSSVGRRDLYLEATCVIGVESSHLLGKNYESLLARVRLPVCFQ